MQVSNISPDSSFHFETSNFLERSLSADIGQRVSLVFLKHSGELRRSYSSPSLQLSEASTPPRLIPISEHLMQYALAFRRAEKSRRVIEYKNSQKEAMSRSLAKTLSVLPEEQRAEFMGSLASQDSKVFFILPSLAILSQLKASVGVDAILLNNEVEWNDDNFEFLPEILKELFEEWFIAREHLEKLSPKDIEQLKSALLTYDTANIESLETNKKNLILNTYSAIQGISIKMSQQFSLEFKNVIENGIASWQDFHSSERSLRPTK